MVANGVVRPDGQTASAPESRAASPERPLGGEEQGAGSLNDCRVVERFVREGWGLGKLIGTRTWGGEIWLDSSNRLSDGGLARAPMMGVYGPEREWLIENHGVEPDIEVDNDPKSVLEGRDPQLERGVQEIMDRINKAPKVLPPRPADPVKTENRGQ